VISPDREAAEPVEEPRDEANRYADEQRIKGQIGRVGARISCVEKYEEHERNDQPGGKELPHHAAGAALNRMLVSVNLHRHRFTASRAFLQAGRKQVANAKDGESH